ncbi:outer membrane receptor for ferrienterochelin and colicin [Anseongella ginsenosidimutans]|uniref:Outer membrane receptor for ferrienterochelin and colicin n=1 Tax=Anseongella ginsenosidimutans TaxID=496056 RepID=A0A4R3KSZ4_9SPHI|nr:TonB-dependent receptor [Anseongella ginsenosidimutans]TCS87363.1 outer membrane receptor for ferrienterochelin and colicin [Anseongella ginsenosidimutans]
MKHWLLLFLLSASLPAYAQAQPAGQRYTLSGYLKDAATGEALSGVTVSAGESGTASNNYGFYSLTLPRGRYTIRFSSIGFEPVSRVVELEGNLRVDQELQVAAGLLEEVVVSEEKKGGDVRDLSMSTNTLDIRQIRNIPALLGEVDIVRSIQLLPGVSTVGEGAGGFNVRGGAADQNLVLLDEAPVYNTSHLFGFFSIFNPDAVKEVTLVKGGIPARYGGRSSSLLDVRMSEGNYRELRVDGGIGLVFSRLALEGPLKKDTASFLLAARRSYIDFLAAPFLEEDMKDALFNFYDLTAKVNYRVNKRNSLFISGTLARDNFGQSFTFNWGNTTTTARWNHLFSDRLFMNLTGIYSNYDYELRFGEAGEQSFNWDSKILNFSLKPDFIFYLNASNTLRFGAKATWYKFEPGNGVVGNWDESNNISLPLKYALESGVYLENEQRLGAGIALQYGLRYSRFNYLGPGKVYTYHDTVPNEPRRLKQEYEAGRSESITVYDQLEPRFSLKIGIGDNSSLKASYNRQAQYLHLVSNTAATTPLDVWTPSTNNIKPQTSSQYAIGYFRDFGEAFHASVELYYKDILNQLDYIDNSEIILNEYLEGELLPARGRAYGAEFFLEKTLGRFTGWVSYTLSRSLRKAEGINNGNWFFNRYDRTHVLNTVLSSRLGKRWTVSGTWVYYSGTPATFPTSRLEIQGWQIPYNTSGRRNNYRVGPYHRLDLSATLKGREGGKWNSSWVFSLYNVYNRRNPYSVFFQQDPDNPVRTQAVRLSVVGSIIPAVTYNFSF